MSAIYNYLRNYANWPRSLQKNVHEVWAAGRLAEGWKYGPERNDALRTHPGLVPYEELSETEKDYDRRTAMGTLKLIQKIGFGIKKVKNV